MSNNDDFGFVFKPIEEFTFDNCYVRIEQNRADGVESDPELLDRYNILLTGLEQKDDAMFMKATDKSALEKYLSAYPFDETAKKYQLRHVSEAKKKIAEIGEDSKRRKKKVTAITLAIIALITISVCWFNYSPVKYIDVTASLPRRLSKYGDSIRDSGYIVGEIESLSIIKYGDSIRVYAETNVPTNLMEMDVEYGSNWLRAYGTDGSYTLIAKPNPDGPRYATIKISAPNRLFGSIISWDSKTIKITQESGVPTYITPERKYISFDKFGKSDKSKLIISTDGVLSIASAPDWCDVSLEPIENGKYECIVNTGKNDEDRKNGQVTFKGGNITQSILVQQESGLASYIRFVDGCISVSPREETKYVDIKTDGTSWSILSKPKWVEVSDNGNNSLKLVISENEEDRKTGTITVKSNNGHTASLTINQGTSKASYIHAGLTSIYAGTSGLDKYVSVSTDGKDWSVYSKPNWLSVTPYYNSMKIYVEIPSNSGRKNEGEIVLASNNGHRAIITVKQDGDPTNFRAAKSSIKFDSGSDYVYVNIDNNSNKPLRVDKSKDWISATATSKGRIKISVMSNSDPARSGYVTVRCGNESCRIDVRQSGWTDCYLCRGRGQVPCGYPALWMNGLHCVQEFVMNYYTGGGYYTYNPCPNCGGSGGVKCSHCNGNGKIKSN